MCIYHPLKTTSQDCNNKKQKAKKVTITHVGVTKSRTEAPTILHLCPVGAIAPHAIHKSEIHLFQAWVKSKQMLQHVRQAGCWSG